MRSNIRVQQTLTKGKLSIGGRILSGVPDITLGVVSYSLHPKSIIEKSYLYSQSPIENTLSASSCEIQAPVELHGSGWP